ncbi:hypothetical protein [Arthrobacter sp.]|uniref:hypothetical protein n=1 Tax=Arthrobacter sp. TaxID=1667 RepID=UPI002811B4DC|nr:hypothetical protein [Arthrobacter sp.]
MPTAVVRIHFASPVEPAAFERGVAFLRERGIPLVEYTAVASEEVLNEISLLRDEAQQWTPDDAVALCAEAFGVSVRRGPVTYVSRGTNADAESVLARFDLDGRVRRETGDDGDIVIVTVSGTDMRRVPESRLHTALEAALNAEVRIELDAAVNAG